jgi:hypothetical protein
MQHIFEWNSLLTTSQNPTGINSVSWVVSSRRKAADLHGHGTYSLIEDLYWGRIHERVRVLLVPCKPQGEHGGD